MKHLKNCVSVSSSVAFTDVSNSFAGARIVFRSTCGDNVTLPYLTSGGRMKRGMVPRRGRVR